MWPTVVEIAERWAAGTAEAAIERIERRGGRVQVQLLLVDGRSAAATLDPLDAEWLDVRAGDIVPVRPVSA